MDLLQREREDDHAMDTNSPIQTHREKKISHSISHLPFRAKCGLTPAIHMVALDFCVVNTEFDDALTILAMKEKPFSNSGCDSDA